LNPKLGKAILDEENNLYVAIEPTDTCLRFGEISILITEEDKKRGRILQQGIPRLSEKIYDVEHLADIIIQV
jgi:dsDNA-specific endonuclease/ATPase MutS2